MSHLPRRAQRTAPVSELRWGCSRVRRPTRRTRQGKAKRRRLTREGEESPTSGSLRDGQPRRRAYLRIHRSRTVVRETPARDATGTASAACASSPVGMFVRESAHDTASAHHHTPRPRAAPPDVRGRDDGITEHAECPNGISSGKPAQMSGVEKRLGGLPWFIQCGTL